LKVGEHVNKFFEGIEGELPVRQPVL
jgi:hypothetical protein